MTRGLALIAVIVCGLHATPWRYNFPSATWRECEQEFTRHPTRFGYCGLDYTINTMESNNE